MKPMLANKYDGHDVTGWLISEKLDGVRAMWDGENLVSRNGNIFFAPEWFKKDLPNVNLDGELYIGRGMFQNTVGIVRKKKPNDDEWKLIKYMVFDAPCVRGGFSNRIAAAKLAIECSSFAKVVEQTVCIGRKHLDDVFCNLVYEGAEGVILRKANSQYEQKRSDSMLKHKPIDADEAEVIGHVDGEGRLKGMVGALICRWKGKEFQIGSGMKDDNRRTAPNIGAIVTFCFGGLTDGGMPRFPVFVSERNYE